MEVPSRECQAGSKKLHAKGGRRETGGRESVTEQRDTGGAGSSADAWDAGTRTRLPGAQEA